MSGRAACQANRHDLFGRSKSVGERRLNARMPKGACSGVPERCRRSSADRGPPGGGGWRRVEDGREWLCSAWAASPGLGPRPAKRFQAWVSEPLPLRSPSASPPNRRGGSLQEFLSLLEAWEQHEMVRGGQSGARPAREGPRSRLGWDCMALYRHHTVLVLLAALNTFCNPTAKAMTRPGPMLAM